ncbi:MAG: metal ABC transporter ATP-binding protein [Alphaproteobacteria bacterium]|nr:metal ABC transporter ATP-binding protein [Alphaproteobacteria bacterium]
MPLIVKDLSCRYAGQHDDVLSNVSFVANSGEIIGVLGPNGAGKSTLIKGVLDLIPHEGEVKFFGGALKDHKTKIAYIPQRSSIDWQFPVSALDVCLMGMYPRIGLLKRITKANREEAMSYLEQVKLADYARKQIGSLSGGQQQRVFMARALAQDADLLFLDEPMAGIDQTTQDLLFTLFKDLKAKGKTILIVHHHLQSAKEHFDRILLINKILISDGPPNETLSQENLAAVYGGITA